MWEREKSLQRVERRGTDQLRYVKNTGSRVKSETTKRAGKPEVADKGCRVSLFEAIKILSSAYEKFPEILSS